MTVHNVGLGHLRTNNQHPTHHHNRHTSRAVGLVRKRHTQHARPTRHSFEQYRNKPTTHLLQRALAIMTGNGAADQDLAPHVIRLSNERHAHLTGAIRSPTPDVGLPIFPRTRVTQHSAPLEDRNNKFSSRRTRSTRHTERMVLMIRQHKPAITSRQQVHTRQERPGAVARNRLTRHR